PLDMSLLCYSTDSSSIWPYTLSLHDALPISARRRTARAWPWPGASSSRGRRAGSALRTSRPYLYRMEHGRRRGEVEGQRKRPPADRKSTRLNSSHLGISYAVFCLKKKKKKK